MACGRVFPIGQNIVLLTVVTTEGGIGCVRHTSIMSVMKIASLLYVGKIGSM